MIVGFEDLRAMITYQNLSILQQEYYAQRVYWLLCFIEHSNLTNIWPFSIRKLEAPFVIENNKKFIRTTKLNLYVTCYFVTCIHLIE